MASRNLTFKPLLLWFAAALSMAFQSACGGSVVGAPCEDGYEHCAEGCVNLRADESNCGGCGKSCESGQTCWEGDCMDCDSQPGTVLCSGECVSISNDPNNCGLCGNVCDTGVPCLHGVCSSCPGDLYPCDGDCVDILYAEEHCGSCNNACLPDEECRGGQCLPPCEDPRTLCGDDCVDLSSSTSHCGNCETQCKGAEPSCVNGRCAQECPEWMSECEGDCIDTYYDPFNCGACGVVCPTSNPVCVAGQCVEGCLPPLLECSRQCIDPQSDPDHCGGCGEACDVGRVCASGQCEIDCGELTRCGGLCVDTEINPAHCGGCGDACQAGRTCIAGECVLTCEGGLAKCAEECVNLYTDREHCGECFLDCGADDLCIGGQCIPDCGNWAFCGFAVGCADLSSDTGNCGFCGNECDEGWFCVYGQCELQCPEELENCNDQCVDLDESPVNCGTCERVCESGICDEGDCREQAAGHLVAIGHDYTQSHAVLRRILGNAVFISQSATVRVLAYTQYADADQMARVDSAISSVASIIGRFWQKAASTDPTFIADHLLENDVLLVYRQNAPDAATLRAVGSQWTSALNAFLAVGGVVVFTDSTANQSGTYNIFDAAGVFSCSGLIAGNGRTASVAQPGDAVVQGTTTSYLASSNSATFSTTDAVIVVVDVATSRPFVVHKTFLP